MVGCFLEIQGYLADEIPIALNYGMMELRLSKGSWFKVDVIKIGCICIISNNVRCYGPAMNLYRYQVTRHDKDSLIYVQFKYSCSY